MVPPIKKKIQLEIKILTGHLCTYYLCSGEKWLTDCPLNPQSVCLVTEYTCDKTQWMIQHHYSYSGMLEHRAVLCFSKTLNQFNYTSLTSGLLTNTGVCPQQYSL